MNLIAQVPLVAAYVYRRSDNSMVFTSSYFRILFYPHICCTWKKIIF